MSNSSAPLPKVTVNVTIGGRTTIEGTRSYPPSIEFHAHPETEHEFESDRETEYEFESDSEDTLDNATADSARTEIVNSRTVDMSKVFNTLDETTATMRGLSERLRVYCERRREQMLAEQNRAATDAQALHSLSKCTDQLSEVEKFAQQQGGH
ncbi:hypothetical protein FA95DRAFT_1560688 [Auriscalpium vulgare]|uniref:Uncharacterized protein n=1 Tax=Auriscalpium vulgare TaxID=40419 RepID=A0ACB8RQA5_9AGAM|nr:hypothetical protein FA95DRAFT_1560688 [Auriscalpium vulgare]